MWKREDLRIYQNFIIGKFKQCFDPDPDKRLPGLIVALEPGAGKSGAVLTALSELIDHWIIERSLIVAPLLVAQTTWPEEHLEWEHLAHLDPRLIRVEDDDPELLAAGDVAYFEAMRDHKPNQARVIGEMHPFVGWNLGAARWLAGALRITAEHIAERARAAAIAELKEIKMQELADDPAPIQVINKEALDWLWEHFGRGKRWPYDVMVIDDCREGRSGVKRTGKNREERSKGGLSRFGVMAAARKYMKATIQLSGTPTPNGLENMWGLTYLIDQGKRLGINKTMFLRRWFFFLDRKTFRTAPKAHAFDEIMDKVKDIMFSLDPKDMPELPPFILNPIKVKLDDAVLAEYRRFKRQLVSEEYDVEAVNGGVLHGKLLQFANGSVYREKGNDIWVHDQKIEALKLLVERLNGTPLLVAYTYEFDKTRILKAFPQAIVLTPENAVKFKADWNADKIQVALAHRASAGHGLNLQKGTGHMCEYGLTTDAELYLQFLKRLWRPGRQGTVFNHVIIAEGTIDEDTYPMYLDPKIEVQNEVMRRVRVSFDTPS